VETVADEKASLPRSSLQRELSASRYMYSFRAAVPRVSFARSRSDARPCELDLKVPALSLLAVRRSLKAYKRRCLTVVSKAQSFAAEDALSTLAMIKMNTQTPCLPCKASVACTRFNWDSSTRVLLVKTLALYRGRTVDSLRIMVAP
jgi:hypothetical protein